MNKLKAFLTMLALALSLPAHAEKITIAAAADLKFAMDEIVAMFRKGNPTDEIEVVYGSSGKFHTQIQQGAPFDLFFSADITYPRELAAAGMTSSDVKPYALGRIVLWSTTTDATKLTLASLADPRFARIAIANPKHAPYGKRAQEALKAAGLWDKVEGRLIYGENIAATAQYVQTGNAQVGVIALSLAVNPELASKGGYWLIPDKLHSPLEQGYVLTKRAGGNALAKQFAAYVDGHSARSLMAKYGFELPASAAAR